MRGMDPPFIETPESAFLVFLVQVFMALCLFFALIYGVPELVLFSLIILAMGLGAYLWSRGSLKHLACGISLNRESVFPGEKLKIDINAVNSKLLPILLKVDLFAPPAIAGTDTGQWISEEIGLLWFQRAAISKDFFPNRRGVFNLGPPLLRGGDLFGFYFKRKPAAEHFEVVVYPRIVDIRPVTLPKREFYGTPGTKSPVEDPIYVYGTRDYQPGRPARGIHWKASARYHRLQEKLCEPAVQEKVLLLLDVDGFENEATWEDFERSFEVIASLVLQMDRKGIAVGFATNGQIKGVGPRIVPISRNSLQTAAILEVLARVTPERADNPVTSILMKGYPIPGGVSSIYFAWNRSTQARSAGIYMKHRNIPVQFVLIQKSSGIETVGAMWDEHTSYLEDILAPENRKR